MEKISRRSAIKHGIGYGLGTIGALHANYSPVYEEKIPPVKKNPIDPSKRQLIVYDKIPDFNSPLKKAAMGASMGLASSNLTHLADSSLHGNKISRRNILKTITNGTLALLNIAALQGLYDRIRTYNAIDSEEQRSYHALIQDLQQTGYHTQVANTHTELEALLENAAKNRTPDARTIVIIKAHGSTGELGMGPGMNTIIQGEVPFPLFRVSVAANKIPGHTLFVIDSCHTSERIFNSWGKFIPGIFSLITINSGSEEKESVRGLPLYSALRLGIRGQDVLKETVENFGRLYKKTPAYLKNEKNKTNTDISTSSSREGSVFNP